MGIIGAMYSGISGLDANGTAMEVIGNNLSNVNTPGFKYSRPEFSDVLSKVVADGFAVGRGAQVERTKMVFSQGGFEATDNVTDLALSGQGFFMVHDPINLGTYYTRAGNFEVESTGFLVSKDGYRLQGFDVDSTGEAKGVPRDIIIPQGALQPVPTSSIEIHANLDSLPTYVGPFDVTDPINTSNFSTAITVYDSLGNPHQVTAYFTAQNAPGPTGGNIWDYNIVVGAEDSTSGIDTVATSGTIEFTTDGAMYQSTVSAAPSFNFVGSTTQGQVIDFNFGTSVVDGGTGLDGTTQFGETNALVYQAQDGYGPSYLEAIEINSDGIVIGKYANGEIRQFARISIVNFNNPNGLAQLGGNLFTATEETGEAIISVANVSGNGSIFSNSLELSNVDIATQFVSMITTQRAYQASSRIVTTTNDMLAEVVNMSR